MKSFFNIKLDNGHTTIIIFDKTSVKVSDCYRLNKNDRKQVAEFIINYIRAQNYQTKLSARYVAGEIAFHKYCYKLGIKKSNSIDADIEYTGDSRKIVQLCSTILSWFENK